jgi:hypothetical protein
MSTVKSKKLQVGTDATASNNFTIYQPATPDGTLRIGVGNADSPTEVGRFNSNGYVATNAPAFSAYSNSTASVSTATWTKVPVNVEEFDTNANYDNATNYRFTPTVEGYYQINGQVNISSSTTTRLLCAIRKNGSEFRLGTDLATIGNRVNVSSLIYMNGTTDYVELWVFVTGTSLTFTGSGQSDKYFNGYLARAV